MDGFLEHSALPGPTVDDELITALGEKKRVDRTTGNKDSSGLKPTAIKQILPTHKHHNCPSIHINNSPSSTKAPNPPPLASNYLLERDQTAKGGGGEVKEGETSANGSLINFLHRMTHFMYRSEKKTKGFTYIHNHTYSVT